MSWHLRCFGGTKPHYSCFERKMPSFLLAAVVAVLSIPTVAHVYTHRLVSVMWVEIEEEDDGGVMNVNNLVTLVVDLPSPLESMLVEELAEPPMVEEPPIFEQPA